MAEVSRVALRRVADDVPAHEAVLRAVAQAMDDAGWAEALPAGRPIAVKPNLGFDLFLPGAVTGPWVVEAVLRRLLDDRRDVVVVEADQVVVNVERALALSGVGRVCADLGVRFVNLSKQPTESVELPDARVLHRVALPRVLR